MEIMEKLNKIWSLCLELNDREDTNVFIYLYGHTNYIQLTVYFKGWSLHLDPEYYKSFYLYDEEKIDEILEDLDKILNNEWESEEIVED